MAKGEGFQLPLPAVVAAPQFANWVGGPVKTQQLAPQVSQEGGGLVQLPLHPATHQPRPQTVLEVALSDSFLQL